ncbi:MAG: hypothetical protein ACRCWR_01170, partial [Saezia sp.]
MTHIKHCTFNTTKNRTLATLLALTLLALWPAVTLAATPTTTVSTTVPQKEYYMQEHSLDNKNWPKAVSEIYNIPNPPPAFDPTRTAQDYLNTCATWTQPPVPDAQAQEWYRAATTLQTIRMPTVQEHRQMLQLYEGAARRGHYLAVKQLTIVYSTNWLIIKEDQRFPRDPQKARYWLNYGLSKGWTGALEWLATALIDGGAQFPRDQKLGMAYLQLASDKGVALAQWQMSLQFRNPRDVAKE